MNSETEETKEAEEAEEKSCCPQEPYKTITVTSFGNEKYEIKFQYFIDIIDVKKEIQRQAMEVRGEHLPPDVIIPIHNNPGSTRAQCKQNHTFLKDEQLFMIVRPRVCNMDHTKAGCDHGSPGLNKDVSCE